ncbi:hypothetical protein HQ520_13945, partial [bacterium]|nr:hypothetical protein [bacterium]
MTKAVLFDLGNTLFTYCDYGLEAYRVRLGRAMEPVVTHLGEVGMVSRDLDLADLVEGIFHKVLETEKRAREDLIEYDVVVELRRALGESFPGVDVTWEDRIDLAVYAIMRELYHPRDDAVVTLRWLRAGGIKTGLLSNTQYRTVNHVEDLRR